jgi:hypothetical protein
MADQPSIFGSTETNTPTQAQTPPTGSNPVGAQPEANQAFTLLSSIKNERGEQKYSTIEAALEGLRNAQEFIPSLRQQTAEKDQEIERLRKEAERVAELERTLAALTSQPQQNQNTTAPVMDETALAELVNRTLSQREQKLTAEANVASVVSTLQGVFGADAEAKFYGKAQELGMSVQEMNVLAAKSPKAVLTMLGVQDKAASKPNQPLTTQGTVNTAAFTPQSETYIGRNPKGVIVGATSQDIQESMNRAKRMAAELEAKGMSVHDLTNPKVYAQYFK